MAEKNVNISKSYDLRHTIFERSMPENLKKDQVSITYAVLQDIFKIIEDSDGLERPLSHSNCDCLNLLCCRDVGNWLKNLVKSRLIRNSPVCLNQLIPEFIAQSTDCEFSPSDVNLSLRIYLSLTN